MADGRSRAGARWQALAGQGLRASLTLSPACLRSPLAWSPRPSASRRGLSVAWPAVFLAAPLTASALCAIFLAILIRGLPFTGSSRRRECASGDIGGGPGNPVTPGTAVLPARCCRPTVEFAVDLQ